MVFPQLDTIHKLLERSLNQNAGPGKEQKTRDQQQSVFTASDIDKHLG